MKKTLAAVLLALPFALSAQATIVHDTIDVECVNTKELAVLVTQFNEVIMLRDLRGSGDGGYSLWVNPDDRTWTFVFHNRENQLHCVAAFGSALEYSGEWK